MRPGTLLRLAMAGTRTDALRVVLTAFSATLATMALLAAATVIAIGGGDPSSGSAAWSNQYSSPLLREPGLRPGVTLALVLLTVPVLALAAQCSRIGAPARERRLAAFRLAGATPAQTVRIAVAETGLAALIGAVIAIGIHSGLRVVLHRPDPQGLLPLPTDVVLPVWTVALIGAAVPALSAGLASLTLRRVVVGPLGVSRQTRPAQPRWWPALLIAAGLGTYGVFSWVVRRPGVPSWVGLALLGFGAITAAIGTVLGVGWLTRTAGRLVHRRARRPAMLIAARRLMADPWSGSRAYGAMLVALIVGAGAAGYRSKLVADVAVQDDVDRFVAQATGQEWYGPTDISFHLGAYALVDLAVSVAVGIAALGLMVAFAERIVSRRRAHVSLIAAGVPRATVAWSAFWQAVIPAVPGALLAAAVGVGLARAFGTTVSSGGYSAPRCGSDCTEVVAIPTFVREVPVPWTHIGVLTGGAVLLAAVAVGLSLALLRTSTDVAELRVS